MGISGLVDISQFFGQRRWLSVADSEDHACAETGKHHIDGGRLPVQDKAARERPKCKSKGLGRRGGGIPDVFTAKPCGREAAPRGTFKQFFKPKKPPCLAMALQGPRVWEGLAPGNRLEDGGPRPSTTLYSASASTAPLPNSCSSGQPLV